MGSDPQNQNTKQSAKRKVDFTFLKKVVVIIH